MLEFDCSEPVVRHRSDKVRASSLPASGFHNSGPPEDLLSRHECQYAMEPDPPVRNPASVTFKAQDRWEPLHSAAQGLTIRGAVRVPRLIQSC